MSQQARIGEDPFWILWTTRLEAAYTALLPFLGGLACYHMESEWVHWVVVGGWLTAVLNTYILVPFVLAGAKADKLNLVAPLLPMGLLALKQGLGNGDIWNFFLDDLMMEAGALMLAFAGMLLFARGIGGDTAWKGLGCGMVILVVGLIFGSIGGLALTWIQTLEGMQWYEWFVFGIAVVFALVAKIRLFRTIQEGEFNPDKTSSIPMEGPIIMTLLAYLILVPLLGNFLAGWF